MDSEYMQAQAVIGEVKKVVTGKDECIQKAFAVILAGGHVFLLSGSGYVQPVSGR